MADFPEGSNNNWQESLPNLPDTPDIEAQPRETLQTIDIRTPFAHASQSISASQVQSNAASGFSERYDLSNPSTPARPTTAPNLFNQGQVPVSQAQGGPLINTVAVAREYKISRALTMPSFSIVDIDRKFAADVLSGYIARGSMITGVDINMIDTSVTSLPAPGTELSAYWLCGHGMPIFDAVVWLCADQNIRPVLKLKTNAVTAPITSAGNLAKALFYCYFYLLTQAKYPGSTGKDEKVPSFLTNVAGLREPAEVYVRRVCSFNPVLFDARWIKDIHFRGFGQESLSRFGLGVAGYRMFAPFKLLAPINPLPPYLTNAYNYARAVAQAPPTWTVHPVTRAPALLTERGNLNRNLANLMLECFTLESLTELAATKQLYAVPARQHGHRNYLTWAPDPGMAIMDPIFPLTG